MLGEKIYSALTLYMGKSTTRIDLDCDFCVDYFLAGVYFEVKKIAPHSRSYMELLFKLES